MVKKKITQRVALILSLSLLVCFGTAEAAGKHSFSYKFKHQLDVDGTFKATKSTANFSIYTTTNNSTSNTFTIKQFEYGFFSDSFVTSKGIGCKKDSTGTANFDTKSGTKYTYEFWKVEDDKYVVGSGTLSY